MKLIQLPISILLFMVLFFGIGFILNMLLKSSWIMACLYPFIVVIMTDNQSTKEYVVHPIKAVHQAVDRLTSLAPTDITVLGMGFVGAILSGIVIKMLRQNGYQMF